MFCVVFTVTAFVASVYVRPVEKVVVAELNLEKSPAVRQPNVVEFAVIQVSALGVVPRTEIGCDSERAPVAVRVVVATLPSLAGVPFVVVQYDS